MKSLTLDEINEAVKGELIQVGKSLSFNSVNIDTRKINGACIYIAIKGENFNGNDFVIEAIKKGANLCIVDEINYDEGSIDKEVSIIKVQETKSALMALAKFYRSTLDIKVIGVTGSTGKTSTKDLIASALSKNLRVFKTKGNFNNEIGLPLMIFQLDDSYDAAILEMGMSNLGEIKRLASTAIPDIAIITNVGISHIENLKTRKNILKAKMEITEGFTKSNTLIINNDNDLLSTIETEEYKVIRTGTSEKCDLKAYNIKLETQESSFNVDNYTFTIPVPGTHNVSNAMLAIACGKELKLSYDDINKGFENLEATSMRLDIEEINGLTIINDTYNASPDSMKAAIDVMKNIKGNRRIAVLGTMKELGEDSHIYHKEVGKYALDNDVDILIAVGEYQKAYYDGFDNNNNICPNTNKEAVDNLKDILQEGDIILVKASRSMHFENIVELLKTFLTKERN